MKGPEESVRLCNPSAVLRLRNAAFKG